jgi:hypothetical protein
LTVLRPAVADVQYEIAGEDVYEVRSTATVSRIAYVGSERLSVRPDGKSVRFVARERDLRTAPDGQHTDRAFFVAELLPDGSFTDKVDQDPDFLTILNQPFAITLDAATLRDLKQLRGRVPFAAGSPLGGDTVLRGYLRPGTSGPVAGRPTVAIAFEASGPMTGALPGYTDATVSGVTRMDGMAYYSLDTAMLLALNVHLTIDAKLHQAGPGDAVPVRIAYRRTIRALKPPATPPGLWATLKTRR